MAQIYYPGSVRSTSSVATERPTLSGLSPSEKQCDLEAYVENKERLSKAIDSTEGILGDVRRFSKNEWVLRYPYLQNQPPSNDTLSPSKLRRSLSFADDPKSQRDVVLTPKRKGMTRAMTLASMADVQEDGSLKEAQAEDEEGILSTDDFHILRLDLKLGSHDSSTSPASLVFQLEKSSIANLLEERMGASASHLDKLRQRVQDTSSKVLVTGDLNAGKSTFVNALLRREVMPVDQQPCTTAFCEVHDAAENRGIEEVHIVKEGVSYSIQDESTFTRCALADLEDIFAENESRSQQVLKVYLSDSRVHSQSLLNNGAVDITLIDAPGLNRDSIKTTAVFTRQEEIDVVVFVVSAENHFTLSAKEFLINASKEKAYLFIVVNKYEQIKNKAKCQKSVYDQIQALSPQTYKDRDELVHFVDSAAALQPYVASPTFDDLESALRSFVLAKRSKSKLLPVATYLRKLLADLELLAGANALVASAEAETAKADLDRVRPVLEKMKKDKEALDETLEALEEEKVYAADANAKATLDAALERVGQGKLGVETPSITMPTYPGIFGVWDYARDVRRALLASLDMAVKVAEDEARLTTKDGVKRVAQLAEEYLPEGVERNRRVFMPEAMFSLRKHGRKVRQGGTMIVAGGMAGLGIGLLQRADLVETTTLDICDIQHLLWVHFGDSSSSSSKDGGEEEALTMSALGLISVAAGALTMIGGQAVGLRGLIEGAMYVGEVLSNESSRKWAAPLVGAGVFGLTAYMVLDLPRSIPRTVGRRVRRSVLADEHGEWMEGHALRVNRETRKVMRIAGYDLGKRFRDAMDERGREVGRSEEVERRAARAREWFEGMLVRTGDVKDGLSVVA